MKRTAYVVAAVVLLSAACSKKENPSEVKAASAPPPKIEVTAARAEVRQVERVVNVVGSLLPDETSTVSTEVPGRIDKVYVDFGSYVKKGQLLAELQTTEATLNLERGKANK